MIRKGHRVTVTSPPNSAQLNKSGTVVDVTPDLRFVVRLDDEDRNRNFELRNLQKEEKPK